MQLVQDTGIKTFQQSKYGTGSYKLDAYNSTYGTTEKHRTYSIEQNMLGQNWTLEFWVYMARVASNVSYNIMSLKPIDGVSPNIALFAYNNQLTVTLNGTDFCTVDDALGKKWTHIALTHNPNTGIAFFCDGARIETLDVYNLYRNVGTYYLDLTAPAGCVCLFDALNFETTLKYTGDTYTVPATAPADIPTFTPSPDTPVDNLHEHTITITSSFEATLEDGTPLPVTFTTTDSMLFNDNLPNLVLAGADVGQEYELYGYKLNGVHVVDSTPILDDITLTANWLRSAITLTVVPSEEDASVTLVADDAAQVGNTITVKPYQTVRYVVKKRNFATVRGIYVMDEADATLNITMTPSTERWYSNFDPSCYITIPNATIGTADAWEQVWHVRTGNKVNGPNYINSGHDGMYADFGSVANVWKFFLSSNNSSWDITGSSGVGTLTSVRNTNYWVKLEFTGTQYIMSVADEDQYGLDQWTVTGTVNSTTKVYGITTYRVGETRDAYWSWFCYIDMGNSYIKVNHKDGDVDNWTYDYNGLTAEAGTDFNVVGDVILVGTELSELISENFGGETTESLRERGVYRYPTSNVSSEITQIQNYTYNNTNSYTSTGDYDRTQGSGYFSYSVYSENYWRTMDYYSVGQWYENLSYSERRCRGWNLWVSTDEVDVNTSNWKNKCTLLDSRSNQFNHNNYIQGDQGRELTYLIAEEKRSIPFRTIVFEATQNDNGGSYTTVYRFKAFGVEIPDPRPVYTFTVNCDKNDATILLTCPNATQNGNSIQGREGQTVTYHISKEGYETVSGTYKLESNYTMAVEMVPYVPPYSYGTDSYDVVDYYLRGAFGGETWPALQEYQFRLDPRTGLYFLRKDETLHTEWKLGSTDWSSSWGAPNTSTTIPMHLAYGMTAGGSNCIEPTPRQVSTITLNPNTGVVHLYPYAPVPETEYVFTLVADQVDATITLESPGFTQSGNTITVKPCATVYYTVAKEGYKTVRGNYTMGESNKTINVTMEEGLDSKVYSGFTAEDYINIATMPDSYSEVDFISYVRTGTTSPMRAGIIGGYSADTGKYFYFGTRNSTWSYRDVSRYHSGNTFTQGAWHWVRLKGINGNISLYTLPDENRNYTLDTLPPLSAWTMESTCTDTDTMNGIPLHIGVGCYTNMERYVQWTGAIDIVSTRVVVDGTSLYDGYTAQEGVDYTIVGTLVDETPQVSSGGSTSERSVTYTSETLDKATLSGFVFHLNGEGASTTISSPITVSAMTFPAVQYNTSSAFAATANVYLNIWEGDGTNAYTYLGSSTNARKCANSADGDMSNASWTFNNLVLDPTKVYLVTPHTSVTSTFGEITNVRMPMYKLDTTDDHMGFFGISGVSGNPPSNATKTHVPTFTITYTVNN